jgi:Zn-dependent dipeptidase, microsomal dipeptidase homolog
LKKQSFVDLHCDTLFVLRQGNHTLKNAPGHINLDMLARGGALLQCFAAFVPMNDCAERFGIREEPWEFFLDQAALFEKEMSNCPQSLRPVRCMADIEENRERGLVSAMLTLEDGACLDGRIERLQTMYDLGVRLVTLTWNYENCIGYPNSADPDLHGKGLKEFGFEVLSGMERLGMAVDVSHLSEGGFWDVVRESKKPFVASHSCARALCDHSRNLTDEQLRALGDAGGVCGVNFYSSFLRKDADYALNEDILLHMEHIADHAGMDAVALGSDFDGIDCTLEMGDYSGLDRLGELIADRFGTAAAEKICSRNALRVFSDVIG